MASNFGTNDRKSNPVSGGANGGNTEAGERTFRLKGIFEVEKTANVVLRIEKTDENRTENEEFILLREILRTLGKLDTELTEYDYSEICAAGRATEAYTAGMRLLAYGRNTARQLEQKLRMRGYDRKSVSVAVGLLKMHGYIKEKDDATLVAEQMMRVRLLGKRRILTELKMKGYTDEAIKAASESLSDDDITEYCVVCIEKKYGSVPTDYAGKQKMFASLLQRGYTSAQINAALKKSAQG